MPDAPASLVALARRVEDRLAAAIDAEAARWQAVDPALGDVFVALRSLTLGGGKRLRPAFCHWGFVGAGGADDDERWIDAGAAFELLHAFALFHDDVRDGSATRRGARSAHLVFADRHAEQTWTGESRRFGEGVAILIGDLAFVYADRLLSGAPVAAQAIWHELRIELNVGQYLDVVGTARNERRADAADRIVRYKSGKYTVERPLHLGAALAAPERAGELLGPLSAYGLPLGDAFQLRDDVLGAFGDETVTGKPVGDDLREGKPTPLLALATAAANPAQHAVLGRIGRPDLDEDAILTLQEVLVSTGALAALEARIETLTHEAVHALAGAPITAEARTALTELAHYVAWRDK